MMGTLRHRPRAHAAPGGEPWLRELDAELRATAELEQARAEATHNQAQAAAMAKAARAEMHYRTLGLDVGGIAAFHRTLAAEDAAGHRSQAGADLYARSLESRGAGIRGLG
jgi:hypothetical protein